MKIPRIKNLVNHPGLIAALGGLVALMGQGAFNKVFDQVFSAFMERQQFPMNEKTIEYYRTLPDPCSPQVRNTIEMWNARIVYEHEANRQWFLVDWASTDKWNAVEPIALHCDVLPIPSEFVYGQPLTLPPVPPAAEISRRKP